MAEKNEHAPSRQAGRSWPGMAGRDESDLEGGPASWRGTSGGTAVALHETDLLKSLVETMTRKIFDGTYPHGKKLRQEVLAEEYDVSRTPIREALRQLEIKGLVTQQWRYGATVVAPTPEDIAANYWLRAELEGMAAERAACAMTPADLGKLHGVHAQGVQAVLALLAAVASEQAGAPSWIEACRRQWVGWNDEFHSLIYKAAGNTALQRIIKDLHVDYTRNVLGMTASGMIESRARRSIEHHQAIVQALSKRDSQAARSAMRRHVMESGEFVVQWLQRSRGICAVY